MNITGVTQVDGPARTTGQQHQPGGDPQISAVLQAPLRPLVASRGAAALAGGLGQSHAPSGGCVRLALPAVSIVCLRALSLQECPTLCDPVDCGPPDSFCPWGSPGTNSGVGYCALTS